MATVLACLVLTVCFTKFLPRAIRRLDSKECGQFVPCDPSQSGEAKPQRGSGTARVECVPSQEGEGVEVVVRQHVLLVRGPSDVEP